MSTGWGTADALERAPDRDPAPDVDRSLLGQSEAFRACAGSSECERGGFRPVVLVRTLLALVLGLSALDIIDRVFRDGSSLAILEPGVKRHHLALALGLLVLTISISAALVGRSLRRFSFTQIPPGPAALAILTLGGAALLDGRAALVLATLSMLSIMAERCQRRLPRTELAGRLRAAAETFILAVFVFLTAFWSAEPKPENLPRYALAGAALAGAMRLAQRRGWSAPLARDTSILISLAGLGLLFGPAFSNFASFGFAAIRAGRARRAELVAMIGLIFGSLLAVRMSSWLPGELIAIAIGALLAFFVRDEPGDSPRRSSTVAERRRALVTVGLGLLALPLEASLPAVTLVAASWRGRLRSPGEFQSSSAWLRRFAPAAIAVAAALLRGLFTLSTERIWEDGLITLQHAENAAGGLGLTHHPDHGLVHGFTSPLNVLIPLAGELIRQGFGLGFFQLVTAALASVSVLLAARIAAHPAARLSTPATLLWLTYIAAEHSQVTFGMAGMETQIWVATLLLGVVARIERRFELLAVALGIGVLSRPEGLLWSALAVLSVARDEGWRRALRVAIGPALVAVLWGGWCTWYYGSPIPQTILAKNHGYIGRAPFHHRALTLLGFLRKEWPGALKSGIWPYLGPHFAGGGTEVLRLGPFPDLLRTALAMLGLVGLMTASRRMRLATWFIVAMGLYLPLIVQKIFPWYPQPTLVLAAWAVARGLDLLTTAPHGVRRPSATWLLSILLIASYLAILPATFITEARVQRAYEDGVRRRIGEWLREHGKPGDTVAIECLGYVGYYSRLAVHDYPGLSSPKALAALRADGRDRFLWPIVERLRPTWLVLRERELSIPDGYEIVHHIGADPAHHAAVSGWLPVATIDHSFRILRRKPESNETVRAPEVR
jgi:hypothetical protein